MTTEVPGRHEKCHATAVNRPGWLTVSTYAVCGEQTCVVNGSGDLHRVVVTNDSPLQYRVGIRGTCLTDGLAYVAVDNTESRDWNPLEVHLDGRRKRRAARSRQLDERLVARRKCDDESIEVTVSWSCVTNIGKGNMDAPLTIQVDARLPA